MDEHKLFGRLRNVGAPVGFESRVLARLAAEKARRGRRTVMGRLAWAGAATAVLAGVVILAVPRTGDRTSLRASEVRREVPFIEPAANTVPVMETMDFGTEIRELTGTSARNSIYILERVAEDYPSGVRF